MQSIRRYYEGGLTNNEFVVLKQNLQRAMGRVGTYADIVPIVDATRNSLVVMITNVVIDNPAGLANVFGLLDHKGEIVQSDDEIAA